MGTIVLLAVIAGIVLWMVGAYNGLISLKNQVVNGWKQIDVQLKRRHDLIPNLVETVKGAMQFERDTLERVVAARAKELTSTENKIGFARQLYNDVATQYNTRQMQFPTNLVAGLAKASPAELWEIEDAGERAVPVVDLSSNKRGA